ncbi:MAG: tetratricopeptide repeat protein [Thermoleophilia bacterium]
MLLDRKRINKWGRWVALFLAIVFGVGFLFMGIGYGGAGLDLSSLFTDDKSANQSPEQRLAAFEKTLAENPKDVTALIGAATIYQQSDDLTTAAEYLERAIAVDEGQKDLYLRLANIYLNSKALDYEAAARVLNKAVAMDPTNPDLFLKLGTAQSNLRNTEAAVLAWQKYLELAPNGEMASVVQKQIDVLTTTATDSPTTGASTTTTAAAQ